MTNRLNSDQDISGHNPGPIPKETQFFTFQCSIINQKLSKLQATKGRYDRGSHFKGLFAKRSRRSEGAIQSI